jgi:hypothetical protein
MTGRTPKNVRISARLMRKNESIYTPHVTIANTIRNMYAMAELK